MDEHDAKASTASDFARQAATKPAQHRNRRPPKPGGGSKAPEVREAFRALAERAADAVGSHWAFLAAVALVAAWAIAGPYFAYSDTWQLAINTSTTIATFLIVFLIQNTQNRETRVVALKLDELLRSVEGARTGFVSLDSMSDRELELVQKEFARLQEKYAPLVDDDLAHVEREMNARKRGRSRPKM